MITNTIGGMQYLGVAGDTQSCIDSILRFIQFGDHISEAKLLTSSNAHCFLLKFEYGDLVAVKSGFSSGYRGQGPGALSTALELLYRHNVDIDEYIVSEELLNRLDKSGLTHDDLDIINNSHPVRPQRWQFYIFHDDNYNIGDNPHLNHNFPQIIPFSILDYRLNDLALMFNDDSDSSIMLGYRRLEDIIRKRTDLDDHGTKLFSKAFQVSDSILCWKDIQQSEHIGRAQLFTATYMAFRNRRAHSESDDQYESALLEFLQLNLLFQFESTAVLRKSVEEEHVSESNDS